MLSNHFRPIEIDGYKFDKGSILYEFDALRYPEAEQFPKVGEFIRSRAEMVQISKPQMYWNGNYFPDLYISNQLSKLKQYVSKLDNVWPSFFWDEGNHPCYKQNWRDTVTLSEVSLEYQDLWFHRTFIEPMCQKISGQPSSNIVGKYHRALWLPMYWPETLIAGQDIETPFYYPKAGYAGYPLEDLPQHQRGSQAVCETTPVYLTFVVGESKTPFSVLFVVDHPSIYRITDQDECAQSQAETHRFVVESNAPIVREDLEGFMNKATVLGSQTINMPIPTIENVKNGWKPGPNMNQMLLAHMGGGTGGTGKDA